LKYSVSEFTDEMAKTLPNLVAIGLIVWISLPEDCREFWSLGTSALKVSVDSIIATRNVAHRNRERHKCSRFLADISNIPELT